MAQVTRKVWRAGPHRTKRTAWGYTLQRGGRQIKKFNSDWTKEQAQAEMAKALAAPVVEQEPAPAPGMTLAQAFERYFRAKARKKSLAEDRRLAEHLKAAFGADTPLANITAGRISAYQEQRLAMTSRQTGKAVSAATVNRPLQLLRHLLRLAARRWEMIDRVPEIQTEKERKRDRFLTPEEARRLLDACGKSRNLDLADIVELAIFTGLRQGDVIGLTWSMVNRAQGQLIVPRQKDDKPLNVPLNAHSDAVLARRAGDGKPTGYVFRSQDWDHYRSAWEHGLERAGLTDVHFHDLRHTFGSWLAQAGRTPKEIQEALGHTTLAMTNRYMHLAPSHLRAAVAVLDGVLGSHASAQSSAHNSPALEVVSQKSLS